jgi:hypothetical protein
MANMVPLATDVSRLEDGTVASAHIASGPSFTYPLCIRRLYRGETVLDRSLPWTLVAQMEISGRYRTRVGPQVRFPLTQADRLCHREV